jgi:hypothetical protein
VVEEPPSGRNEEGGTARSGIKEPVLTHVVPIAIKPLEHMVTKVRWGEEGGELLTPPGRHHPHIEGADAVMPLIQRQGSKLRPPARFGERRRVARKQPTTKIEPGL